MDDMIYRQAAIDEIREDADWLESQGSDWQAERKERDFQILTGLPSAQPSFSRSHEYDRSAEPCGDVVSRADMLNELDGWIEGFDANCHKESFADMKLVRSSMSKLPSAQPEQHWIPCSEKLPEEGHDVLVSVYFMGLKQTHTNGWNDHIKPSYYVDIASHIDGEWSSASAEYKAAISRHKVIAWMPLPESWKGEKDEHID